MGAELCHTATYYFNGGDVTWTAYEYPQGDLEGDVQVEVEGGEIIQNFDGYESQEILDQIDEPPDDY